MKINQDETAEERNMKNGMRIFCVLQIPPEGKHSCKKRQKGNSSFKSSFEIVFLPADFP